MLVVGVVAVLAIGPAFLGIAVGPLAGAAAAILAILVYGKLRYRGGGGFGPLWLELVDMMLIGGNLCILLVNLLALVRNALR